MTIDTSSDGDRPRIPVWDLAVGIVQLGILVLFLLLLRGCSGKGGTASDEAEPTDDFGCVEGRAALYAGDVLLWGDLHAHTVFSDDAATANPPPEGPSSALAYAADPGAGNLDFAALTDHAETESEDEWAETVAAVKAAETALFIPFVGFEYTNVNFTAGRGHKCVILRDPDAIPEAPIGVDKATDPGALWGMLDASPASGDYITIPHHPAKGIDYGANMATDWAASYVNATCQPAVEIYSAHGSSEAAGCEEPVDRFQEDRSVDAALGLWLETHDPGYKLGILASTDNHKATPGAVAEIPENVAEREGEYTGGLAAVWAHSLSRQNIWDALLAKKFYATSGGRIGLEFTAKASGGIVPMGGTLTIHSPTDVFLHVRGEGERGIGIDRIEIVKNGLLLASGRTNHLDYIDRAVSADAYYRVKVYQNETAVVKESHCRNERAWSSPIWIESD